MDEPGPSSPSRKTRRRVRKRRKGASKKSPHTQTAKPDVEQTEEFPVSLADQKPSKAAKRQSVTFGSVRHDEVAIVPEKTPEPPERRRSSIVGATETLFSPQESNQDILEGEALFTMFSSEAVSSPRSRAVSPYYSSDSSDELQDTMFISEASFHGLIYTLLHCFSGAAVSILTKRLKFVPKAKIAFYVAFSLMTGSMPGAFGTKVPFGPLHLQPLLLLRAFFGIASTMFKAMALAYLHVSDVVVISTLIPIGVSLGSWLFLHEKIHPLQWLSMAMTMLGVAIIVRPASLFGSHTFRLGHFTGLLFALGSVLSTIQLMVVVRYMRNLTRLKLGFNGNCARVLLSIMASILSGGFDDLLTGRFLGMLMMMSDINFCALVFIVKALEKESAVVVTTVKLCGDIIISMLLEAIFLDSYPDPWGLTGSAVIIASSLLLAFDKLVHTYEGKSPYMYWFNRICKKFSRRSTMYTEL